MRTKKILSTLVCLFLIFTLTVVESFALSWDGDNANTGGFGYDANTRGYAIRFTENNCIGYRFSVVDIEGNTRNGAVIDVFRKTKYGKSQYSKGYKFTVKYNKKQLIKYQYDTFSTSRNTFYCYNEADMDFASALPSPDGMQVWQNDGRNLNPILLTLGINNISDLNYGDKILVEPIYDVSLEGIYHAVTVTELAVYGQACFGANSNGGTSYTSETWGFIAAYTNKHYPNELYTPDGQGLWEGASVLSKKATFSTIIRKGYGVGIAYTEMNNVQTDSLRIEAIFPNAVYTENTDVITAFRVYNDSSIDIHPGSEIYVDFGAYLGSEVIESQRLSEIVIPANDSNLIWFKWSIPSELDYSDITVSGTVCTKDKILDTDSMIVSSSPPIHSQAPDTQYEKEKPKGYTIPSALNEAYSEAVWGVWKYTDDNVFEYVEYGIKLDSNNPYIYPDIDCPSAVFSNGVWKMGSGYGIMIEYDPIIAEHEYFIFPNSSDYTEVQQAYVAFPEFYYKLSDGNFRSLENTNEGFIFNENEYADNYDRLHFTPLWFPDKKYTVSVTSSDVWTPAGMITNTSNSNSIVISGSAYDDWYISKY